MIAELLTGETAVEKASIKGREIAKVNHTGKFLCGDLEIEITDLKQVEGGVEVFARAWKNGTQLGFGEDGSVDIERFKIFNPPILVADENGDIERQSVVDGVPHIYKLREDPVKAIQEVLIHTVSLVGKEGGKVIVGKVGNTTSTFYPNAGGVSPGDVRFYNGDDTWANLRADTSCLQANVAAVNNSFGADKWGAGATQFDLYRSAYCFDTSIIDTDTISSAVLSIFKDANAVRNADTTAAHICAYTGPTGAFDVADYDIANFGSTSFANIDFSSISTSAYNDFDLDANGIASINKTGITGFGGRNSIDQLNGVAPTGNNDIGVYFADETGTTRDPKLVVTHAAGGGGGGASVSASGLSLMGVGN